MEMRECMVVAVQHTPRFISGCTKCTKVLREGTWAVGLQVGGERYLVCANPPVRCCDEDKRVIEAFDTAAEAEILVAQVIAQIAQDGNIKGLNLCEVPGAAAHVSH